MYTYDYYKRIRYGETDQMGYLYYGNYPLLYEIGRSELIRSLDLTYRELEEDYQIMMPVVEVISRYRKPLLYDENSKIRTILKDKPGKMITFSHEIFNDQDDLVHNGTVKLFFIDMNSNKRVSTPEVLLEKLRPYFD